MTILIFTASVGINVFKHICGECHEAFYTVDMITPSLNTDCECSGDCSCNSHELCKETHTHTISNIEKNKCGMDNHDHDYFHVDQLFFQSSKFSVTPIVTNLIVHTFEVLNTIKEWTNRDSFLRECVNSSSPDISAVNCCFII